ncbi:MAG: DUF4149 domain-containing protein [Nitrospiraceae bacterium]|nr:DUF4149 domain-containing protein [Nitrospirota bacterium]MEC4688659.1 DUF4149 domain-containing protein [Nitrospirota bacterium]
MVTSRAARAGLMFSYTCELVALGIWIGGLVVIIASVIPAVFNSFGMEPGGRYLTRVFDGYNRVVMAAIVVMVGAAAFRFWAATYGGMTEAVPTKAELTLFGAMIVVVALIVFAIGPELAALQERAFKAQDEATRKAALNVFFRSHTIVRGLYLLNLTLGVLLLGVKVRGWVSQGTTDL